MPITCTGLLASTESPSERVLAAMLHVTKAWPARTLAACCHAYSEAEAPVSWRDSCWLHAAAHVQFDRMASMATNSSLDSLKVPCSAHDLGFRFLVRASQLSSAHSV